MDDGLHIFAAAYLFVEARLEAVLQDAVADLRAAVAGPLRAAVLLYVVLYGYALLRGAVAEPMTEFLGRAFKLAFITALATTEAYHRFVAVPLFSTLPQELSQALGGAEAASVGAAFDEILNVGGYLAAHAMLDGDVFQPGPYIAGAVVWICAGLAAALGFGVVLIAKIALALLVALGPAFVALALFETTRRFFFGWLAQGVNYLVLFALILAAARLLCDLVRDQWPSIAALDPSAAAIAFSALCLVALFIFLQTPSLAAGLAGGASVGLLRVHGLGQGTPAPRTPTRPAPAARSGGALQPVKGSS